MTRLGSESDCRGGFSGLASLVVQRGFNLHKLAFRFAFRRALAFIIGVRSSVQGCVEQISGSMTGGSGNGAGGGIAVVRGLNSGLRHYAGFSVETFTRRSRFLKWLPSRESAKRGSVTILAG